MYHDHKSWYDALAHMAPEHEGKRFPTPSGKVELYTEEMDRKLRTAGHSALPEYFTHPEVTGDNETLSYSSNLIPNPIHPNALTPKVTLGVRTDQTLHERFPLMGMIGRASVVHFAGVTQWTYLGKQMNGVRHIQIHPKAAERAGVANGDEVIVESPRGQIRGTALLWEGIREDSIFVPNSFGPAQRLGDDFGLPRYDAANELVDDRYFDNLSGQQAYKCFACRVSKA